MDEGEDKMTALAREVREETGYGIVSGSVRELGHVVEYRNYCGLHQISYCYAVKVGELGSTNPTTLEKSQGIEVFWAASIDDAVKNIRENQATTDEDGDEIGLVMMNLRDIAILQAARATTDLSRAS